MQRRKLRLHNPATSEAVFRTVKCVDHHVQGASVAAARKPGLSIVMKVVPAWWSGGSHTASHETQPYAHVVAGTARPALHVARDPRRSVQEVRSQVSALTPQPMAQSATNLRDAKIIDVHGAPRLP